MITCNGFAALHAGSPLEPFRFERRDPGKTDIVIEILFCGVCHSDIHQARDEWGGSMFPMVPGHEIVGRVTKVGGGVKNFREGDLAGVGCMVDSCRTCSSCKESLEQFCEKGCTFTYNGMERDGSRMTYGGYSDSIVVDEAFALRVPKSLELSAVAPLLCAGITTYSPLRHWNLKKGQRLGVVGLGGLGHMALKFGKAFGAEVTLFTSSASKRADGLRLGASEVVVTSEKSDLEKLNNKFHLILDSVSAPHDLNQYLGMLRPNGTLIQVGAPTEPVPISAFSLIIGRKSLAGSLIGGIKETQEMLDFCGEHGIVSDIELIPIQQINTAYERMLRSDVKYRFVIDCKSLAA